MWGVAAGKVGHGFVGGEWCGADELPGESTGYCGWTHFWLLRIWEVTVVPLKLDTTPQNLWIFTRVSVLSIQPSFPMFSPYYWIYILQTKVPFIYLYILAPFLHYDRKTSLLNEKTRDSYFPMKS